ncbi:MAG TPA: hypothetical protein VMV00_00715 [Candidatus Baltobacteraceae bacterium]|nr:hypothetical protein [Candidatus Baltobacteraceae bacterium]
MAPDQINPNIKGETKTSIDALVDLLNSRGKMELNAVADTLGVNSNLVESWAKVLENGGLVKIDYEVGKMYLEPLRISKESMPNIKSKMVAQTQAMEETLSSDQIATERFMTALDKLGTQLSGIDAEYKKRMPEIQQMMGELNKAAASVQVTDKTIDDIRKNAESSYAAISKRLEELSGKITSFGSLNSDASIAQSVERLTALRQKATEAQNAIAEIEKSKNRAFDTIMKSIDSEVKEIRKQIGDANRDVEAQLKSNRQELEDALKHIQGQHAEAKHLSDQLKAFRGEHETYKRALDKTGAEARDKFARMNDQLQKDIRVIDESSGTMTQKLNSAKSIFGGVATFDQTLNSSKAEIEALKKEAGSVKAELEELAGQLRAFKSMSNMTLEKSMAELKKLSGKTAAATAKVSGLKGKVTGVKQKMEDDSKKL